MSKRYLLLICQFLSMENLPLDNGNILNDLYPKIVNLPIYVRNRIMVECDWSMPTFYRKMHSKPCFGGHKTFRPFSNAEKDKIIAIFKEALLEMLNYLDKHKE